MLEHTANIELCIDFTNTVSGRAGGSGRDRLPDYATFIGWSRNAGTIDDATAARQLAWAQAQPAAAHALYRRAVDLREAIYRILLVQSEGMLPAEDDLALLNTELSHALAHLRLQPDGASLHWAWAPAGNAPDSLLWPIAASAAALLAGDELDRVRKCAKEGCGWLFIDRSKNRSRRWCDMKECGNVVKVRRYRARHKHDEIGS